MLQPIEVKSLWQALEMRNIRNQCRQWMTHYSKNIGIWDQLLWWFHTYSPRRESGRLYCYLFYIGDIPIGYGLASIKPDGIWISGGLAKQFRGQGYGQDLFTWLTKRWGDQRLYLDVFETNLGAIKIYKRLGFRKIGRRYRQNVIIMRRSKQRKTQKDVIE